MTPTIHFLHLELLLASYLTKLHEQAYSRRNWAAEMNNKNAWEHTLCLISAKGDSKPTWIDKAYRFVRIFVCTYTSEWFLIGRRAPRQITREWLRIFPNKLFSRCSWFNISTKFPNPIPTWLFPFIVGLKCQNTIHNPWRFPSLNYTIMIH